MMILVAPVTRRTVVKVFDVGLLHTLTCRAVLWTTYLQERMSALAKLLPEAAAKLPKDMVRHPYILAKSPRAVARNILQVRGQGWGLGLLSRTLLLHKLLHQLLCQLLSVQRQVLQHQFRGAHQYKCITVSFCTQL